MSDLEEVDVGLAPDPGGPMRVRLTVAGCSLHLRESEALYLACLLQRWAQTARDCREREGEKSCRSGRAPGGGRPGERG